MANRTDTPRKTSRSRKTKKRRAIKNARIEAKRIRLAKRR